jgi:hypothetical protein
MAGGWQGVTLRIWRLEAVNLYQILLCNVVGDQECRHILALITLQLNDLSQLCVIRRIRRLETVNLYQVLLCDVVGDQECRHILALITLQLNDLSQLCVLHDCAVAAKFCAPISMARSAM